MKNKGKTNSFKDLIVWQEAMNLVEMIYKMTRHFPKEELFGLTSQMRRAAISIPSNIAEGNGRKTRPDYLHFLTIAHGSLTELETHILIAERIELATNEMIQPILMKVETVGKSLNGLRKSLKPSNPQPPVPNP